MAEVENALNTPLLERALAPISQASPAGEDVTYDDDFQRVKTEIDKLESASASGVDYGLVVELSDRILSEKAKDLRIAAYLAMGLINTRGLEGGAEGVVIINRLLQDFWDDLHPPVRRMRARRNALQALSDRLKEWVAAEKPTSEDETLLEAAVEEMKQLQSFVLEAMGETAPAVSGLTQAFEAALRRVPKEEAPPPSPEQPPPQSAPSGPATAASAPAPAPAGSAAPAPQDFRSAVEAQQTCIRVARYLRSEEKTSPVPFLLLRAVNWGALEQLPPNEGGKTRIPAPPAQRRAFLNGLIDRGEYATLIEEAESSLAEAPFWFDAQRMLVSALDASGPPFSRVRDAVLYELAVLLKRFPGLSDLTFADDTPFADAATQGWLELRVQPLLAADGRDGASVDAGGTAEAEYLATQYQEARSRLAENDLEGALAIMDESPGEPLTGRDHFRRRLYVAELCMTGGQIPVARPLLESLAEDVRARDLETWEPSLALQVYLPLHRCYDSLAGRKDPGALEQEFGRRGQEIFERICRLDARKGLTLR